MSIMNNFTPPPNLHKGSKSEFGGSVDIEGMIEASGCSIEYFKLEECLGEYNRDWRKCQATVQALKSCSLLNKPVGEKLTSSQS